MLLIDGLGARPFIDGQEPEHQFRGEEGQQNPQRYADEEKSGPSHTGQART